MAQKHNPESTNAPMTRLGTMEGPQENKRIVRSSAYLSTKWASDNTILQLGEVGYETDTHLIKVGDGVTAWNDLPYAGDATGTTIVSVTASTLTQELANNTIYDCGELTALTITLPATINADWACQVNFTSGTTPTALTAPNTIKWKGDDLTGGVFVPVASKRYAVLFFTDGVNVRGIVQAVA